MSTTGANVSTVHAKAAQRHPHAGPRLGDALTPLTLAPKPPPPSSKADLRFQPPSTFSLESTFEEAVPEAEYPADSWWFRPPAEALRRGGAPSALVYPIHEVVDEHYSVYWDLARA